MRQTTGPISLGPTLRPRHGATPSAPGDSALSCLEETATQAQVAGGGAAAGRMGTENPPVGERILLGVSW